MRIYSLSTVLMLCALFLLYAGYLSLQNSLITNAIESRLSYLSSHSDPIVRDNDKNLGISSSHLLMPSAHLLNTYVLFKQWQSYLNDAEATPSYWSSILKTSSYIRPTWPNTYVELSKLTSEPKEAKKYQRLAMIFGPYSHSSRLLLIDTIFSNWENSQVSLQVEASQHLIAMTRIWRHRSSLNQMISHSEGKQRICNMLAFNKLKVPTCE